MELASWKKLTVLALRGISCGERANLCMIKPLFLQCGLRFVVATRAYSLPCGWNNKSMLPLRRGDKRTGTKDISTLEYSSLEMLRRREWGERT